MVAPDLFSAATVAVRKREMQEALQRSRGPANSSPRDPAGGSSAPAGTARRLQFRCLHCRATLQVRPVKDLSRTACPKCKGKMLIDPAGVVSKDDGSGVPGRSPGTHRKGFRETAHSEPKRAQARIDPPRPAPAVPPAPEAPAADEGHRTSKKKKPRPPIAEGGLVRVSAFLPPDVIEKIQESGKPVSQYIRETLAEKVEG